MPCYSSLATAVVLFLASRSAAASCSTGSGHDGLTCRFIPGDAGWPSLSEWDNLNRTIQGRLVSTVPVASVCHVPSYSETECDALKKQWDLPQTHILSPGNMVAPLFQSCNPFTASSKPCGLGNNVPFSINVSSAEDVMTGMRFAKEKNVRLVIQNTGHDLLGKSTGKGGLSLWMHSLNSIEVLHSYNNHGHQGAAMKIGAGVIVGEALLEAKKHGFRVVGGSSPSVGLAGGYTQGGGHSLLSGLHGLGADNVLEWEVVTPSGEHLLASPKQNEDLYWALSGGGGGTYGVVLSMTLRLHRDGPVGGAFLTFNSSETGYDTYWKAIDSFHASLPRIVDTGAVMLYLFTKDSFMMYSLAAPERDEIQVGELFTPFLKGLDQLKVSYVFVPTSSPDFNTHLSASFGPLPYGTLSGSVLSSSRLIPRSAVIDRSEDISVAFKTSVKSGNFAMGCLALNAKDAKHPDNAVLPAWRDALLQCIPNKMWDWTIPRTEMEAYRTELTEVIVPALIAATPGSGSYINEVDFEQPNWQKELYGGNYARLLKIKQKYDPEAILFAATAVGSEAWETDGQGRLCRKEADSGNQKGWDRVREL